MLSSEQLSNRITATGAIDTSDIVPCTPKNQQQLEQILKCSPPKAYRSFLSTMGRGAGEFVSELTIFFPDVLTNTAKMREILAACNQSLPDNTFVFIHQHGEQMLYLSLKSDDDPDVSRGSIEEPDQFPKLYTSIWDWIEEEVSGYEYCFG